MEPKRTNLRALAWHGLALVMLTSSGILGCAGDRMAELEAYVEEVKRRESKVTTSLPVFPPVEQAQAPSTRVDPFKPIDKPASRITPPMPRPRAHPPEALEQYPLDSLRMVGTFARDQLAWALIRDPEGIIHHVRRGNHLGQSYGKIIDIAEDHIALTEIVADPSGIWLERPARLALYD